MGPNCAAALRPDGQTSKLQTTCGCTLTWSLRGNAWVTVKKNWACRECADGWGPLYAASKWLQVNSDRQCDRCVPKAVRPPVPPIPATAAASSGSGAAAAAAPKAAPMAPPEPTPTREQGTAMSGDLSERYREDASVGTPANMMFRFVTTADNTNEIQSGEFFAKQKENEDLRNFHFGNM